MTLARYPRYRDSGVSWLGEVPEHWKVRRLKFVADVRPSNVDKKSNDGDPAVRLCNYVDVYYNHRITGNLDLMEATATPEQIARLGLRVGDVVLTKDSETPTDIAVPAVVAEDVPGLVCGYHLAMLRPEDGLTDGFFLAYALKAQGIADQFYVEANGITRYGLSTGPLSSVWVPLPSLEEQRAIAAFLDRKTKAIDGLIAAKQRLLAGIERKKQAIISHTIQAGLQGTATTESGVPSLGCIPAHWRVMRLMYLTEDDRPIQYGIVLPGPHVDDGVPIVKSGDCHPDRLHPELLNRTTREIEAGYVRSRLRPGDLVIAIRGSVGMTAIVPPVLELANLTQDAARIAPIEEVDRRWLLYALKSAGVWAQLEAGVLGATVKGINVRDLKRPKLPVPPPEEQIAIADFLEREVGKIDAVEAAVTGHIERLRRYRQAVITAAVLGQVLVGEVADAR